MPKSFLQAQRKTRSRKRPNPQRGSKEGDVVVGQCASCGEPVCRGDSFVVTLADATLHTGCIKPYFDGVRAQVNESPKNEQVAPDVLIDCGWIGGGGFRIAGDEDPF